MNKKSEVVASIAEFVDWFGRRWIANRSAQEEIGANADISLPPNSPTPDPGTATCIACCPPIVHGKLLAHPGVWPVHLQFRASLRVPGGFEGWCVGFEDIHSQYRWQSSWAHPGGATMTSFRWSDTVKSVAALRAGLQLSVGANDVPMTRIYCLQILRWGGVSGAIDFIDKATAKSALHGYLRSMKSLLNVSAPCTSSLTHTTIHRFDAGMTKIHSIFDDDWTPIYDSRVGAAIAMLFELYYAETGTPKIAGLSFPSGAARGSQVRDPGYFPGLNDAPQLHTPAVPPHVWAQYQVKLAWVIEALLIRYPTLFAALGSNASRAHAFEATLFILGYDLRCFIPAMCCLGLPIQTPPRSGATVAARRPTRGSTWVPTGIVMQTAANLFLEYSTARGFVRLSRAEFVSWQTLEHMPPINRNSANANASILRSLEFDLCERTEAEIRCICAGGELGLRTAMAGRSAPVDERESVFIVSALIVGTLNQRGLTGQQRQIELSLRNIAFTKGSQTTLLSVGKSTGLFFGLLDRHGSPTTFFRVFFGVADWQDLLEELLPLPDSN